MIVLAIDTCDVRGSVSILEDAAVLHTEIHEGVEEYSSWVLPAVGRALLAGGKALRDVDLYAVSAGPGSFTGVRIGLTTVKAWGEVFGKPIVAVSRLEVLAGEALRRGGAKDATYVASFVAAQRDQIFGAHYKRVEERLILQGEELAGEPEDFLARVEEVCGRARVQWVSTDPTVVARSPTWFARTGRGDEIVTVACVLAPMIAKLGYRKAAEGSVVNALELDANYVRRPYVEVNWKGSSGSETR
jgi:tRNA threonylcarbamoyladenosine biosynthesis protein TsaB